MARLVRTGQQFGSLLRPPASPIAGLKACPSKLFLLLLLTQLGAYRTATNLSWAIWHKCTSALYALFQLDFFDDDTATFWACPPLKRVAFVGHLLWLPPIHRTKFLCNAGTPRHFRDDLLRLSRLRPLPDASHIKAGRLLFTDDYAIAHAG